MQSRSMIIIGAAALLILVVGVVFFYGSNPADKYSASNTPTDTLLRENSDYARAKTLSRAGNYAEAEQAYNAALEKATDPVQRAQIQFNIAAGKDYARNYVESIKLFKQLAEDKSNIPILRAYAVQWMADINNNGDLAVTQELFSTEPYKSMVVAGDVALTNRHLAEYCSAIYPLGLCEMFIAYWYAEQLAASPSSDQALSYVSIIKKKIENAEKDIERVKDDSAASGDIPTILSRMARVNANLALAGAGSGADAEAAFQRTFTSMTTYGMKPWYDEYARMNYALFLMRMYGKSRAADIHATLSPIYTDAVYKNAPIVAYLRNIASGNSTILPEKKKYIGQLTNYDTGWKTYLLSLGWKESDFK